MDNEKVNQALTAVLIRLQGEGLTPEKDYETLRPRADSDKVNLAHILAMAHQALQFPPERLQKKMRWLGFIQGVLWAEGMCSIEDLKKMNMPEGEAYRGV